MSSIQKACKNHAAAAANRSESASVEALFGHHTIEIVCACCILMHARLDLLYD